MVGEKKEKILLAKSEISLWLDTYDDIFSDFDPRPYAQRALSDDFLNEAKKASREKGESFELRLLIDTKMRNQDNEVMIKRRLHEHFKKHTLRIHQELSDLFIRGILFVIVGFIMMIIATFLADFEIKSMLTTFAMVTLEPAGWFAVWAGFDHIFYMRREKTPEHLFNEKMSKADIIFESY
jgi:hypothetical protein